MAPSEEVIGRERSLVGRGHRSGEVIGREWSGEVIGREGL